MFENNININNTLDPLVEIKNMLNNCCILIVDDTAYNIYALKTMFSSIIDLKIDSAYNG